MATPTFIIYDGGVTNPDKAVISHSNAFPDWGLRFRDIGDDAMIFQRAGIPVLSVVIGNGNVGIGTADPSARLEVDGDVRVTGDIFLTSADCAEDFDIAAAEQIEPGTVMVITQSGVLQQSEQAYDKRVAGVIAGAGTYKPGVGSAATPAQSVASGLSRQSLL
jgi:hypothetical protein